MVVLHFLTKNQHNLYCTSRDILKKPLILTGFRGFSAKRSVQKLYQSCFLCQQTGPNISEMQKTFIHSASGGGILVARNSILMGSELLSMPIFLEMRQHSMDFSPEVIRTIHKDDNLVRNDLAFKLRCLWRWHPGSAK